MSGGIELANLGRDTAQTVVSDQMLLIDTSEKYTKYRDIIDKVKNIIKDKSTDIALGVRLSAGSCGIGILLLTAITIYLCVTNTSTYWTANTLNIVSYAPLAIPVGILGLPIGGVILSFGIFCDIPKININN